MHIFVVESFMDELAELAGQDPVAFRLGHLRDERARHVLEVAASPNPSSGFRGGWTGRAGPDRQAAVGAGAAVKPLPAHLPSSATPNFWANAAGACSPALGTMLSSSNVVSSREVVG